MEMTGMRLLVLEDEYLIGLDLERIAEECGAKSVELISTIDGLLDWIDRGSECDIAILDVQAGNVPSFQAALVLKERGIPIVFTTAYDQSPDLAGFAGVPIVGKPYGKQEIVQAVASLRRTSSQACLVDVTCAAIESGP